MGLNLVKLVMFLMFVILVSGQSCVIVYAREVPYTQEDRERLIRLETKVEEGLKALNQRIDGLDKRIDGLDKRIDSLDKRIDGLQGLMYVVIGAIFAQTVGIVGFVLWDRRTALAPAIKKAKELEDELSAAIKKTKELEEREYMLEKAIKDYAQQEPRLAEALRSAKLM